VSGLLTTRARAINGTAFNVFSLKHKKHLDLFGLVGYTCSKKERETKMKLKKATNTSWNGNGFGTASATWVVAERPDISIVEIGCSWYAISQGDRIARGFTRNDCLESLERKLNAK